MTDNDLILMAHDAGFPVRKQLSGNVQIASMSMNRFRSFAERAFAKGYQSGCSAFAMAVQIEREECAKTCERLHRTGSAAMEDAVLDCADAIRERSNAELTRPPSGGPAQRSGA